ncbi:MULTISPECIES: efflux RND transporter permease subunit [Marinobacter]|uniref:RND multidrug efflux transporter/ Acriflavin resistance protein n=1 Tax=Marinobacter excellens LAMA 842 TaxID=1306954 RepID=A0A137SFZ3_9GAMM|nr:efflux RND transporter permease subunit [Marinobacter excellens]KXO10666.1 RND multidrug efflux transporter/ Acriflavin resistance protein [Marinobacter excellens LAMA 842]KXO11330.1 RND multidrug efflux transporter/ Acriflavin resistance protein [Marinobacter excellens LAMA 842]
MRRRKGIIGFFVHHRVAGNLVMLVMILGGVLALSRMNIQFFPTFALDVVSVRVVWSGASAEDVERGITDPLEQRLRSVDGLKKMTSTSAQGISSITLEFHEGTDPIQAVDDVRQQVDEFNNLPADAEEPQVARIERYEPVARLLIYGDVDRSELRNLVYRFEDELLDRGIDRIAIRGLPEQQISIDVPAERLETLGLSLEQIADRVASLSRDLPAGMMAQQDATRELRSIEQRRSPQAFETVPVLSGDRVRMQLGDIAIIRQEARDNQTVMENHGVPAVELQLQRSENGNSLAAAKVLEIWLEDTRPVLPDSIKMEVYDETWQLLQDRISLLVNNGLGGLVLVVGLLYLFLPGRVAMWVAIGIPTAFLAALAVLWLIGGSINMISLFALIMALGVIVDDAIVVGEDADAHARMGEESIYASEGAAKRMVWPVLASSLTTVAAFMPLLVVGGVIGNILGDIPLVMICVLIASLVECFIVLPAHLRHAFKRKTEKAGQPAPAKRQPNPVTRLRNGFERRFDAFRDGPFRRFSRYSLKHRGVTVASALALAILTVGLLAGGRLGFNFFPTPEPSVFYANASFVAGTDKREVADFMREMQRTLNETEQALGGNLILHAVTTYGATQGAEGSSRNDDELGSMLVELVPSDRRDVRNPEFIEQWRKRLPLPAGLDSLNISERQSGPPGRDVNIRLTGDSADNLKRAADEVAQALSTLPGVLDVEDDMPWGREQLIYQVSPYGEALGLTTVDLGRQLRAAFDGRIAQIYQDGRDEIEVRVQLPRDQRERYSTLEQMTVRIPDGRFVPLTQVMNLDHRQGFQALRHADGKLAVEVTSALNTRVATTDQVLESLQAGALPDIASRYGVRYSFEGRSADQRETMDDMKTGLMIGLALMYVVLAWVFASWSLPLIVMAIIPFALVGALLGHWLMGLQLTILSLFGLFGLSGIVVNNAIILVSFYNQQRQKGLGITDALNEAAVQRVRAVLLTSLTTIGGLLPLLFETSLQAQFLIPMATSIAFGLGLSTFLVLLVIPALLSWLEQFREWRAQRHGETPEPLQG